MTSKVIDQRSNSAERAIRLKTCREMTGLSRDMFNKRYGIPRGTIQNWETARFGGLTPKGAKNIVKAFHAEGIRVTADWLLHGLGNSPQFSDSLEDQIKQTQSFSNANTSYDNELIAKELESWMKGQFGK